MHNHLNETLFRRGRNDLMDSTFSKQKEAQVVQLQGTSSDIQVNLRDFAKNFLDSGLDSTDVHVQIKSASISPQIQNVFEGDYVELYCDFSAIEVAVDPSNSNTGTRVLLFPAVDQTAVAPFKLPIYQGKKYVNSYEFVELLNQSVKQYVQENSDDWVNYAHPDGPMVTNNNTFEIGNKQNVLNALLNGVFTFDAYSQKIGFKLKLTTQTANRFEYNDNGDPIVTLANGTQTYTFGSDADGTHLYGFEFASLNLYMLPGRNLTESRYNHIATMLGMDVSNLSFTQGQISGAFNLFSTNQLAHGLQVEDWALFSSVYGSVPSTFTLLGTSQMVANPVREVYINSSLGQNVWSQKGHKLQNLGVFKFESGWGEEVRKMESNTVAFASKESIHGLMNFFIRLCDKFGVNLVFNENYFIELAVMLK